MPFWSRIVNALRGDRVSRDLDEEFQSHLAEAVESGREPAEARRAFGPSLRLREESRDLRLLPWLESLCADAVFGWRQILKHKVVSGAAILSLALAIGTCASAFRLIDALLLRPLPIAAPDRLYAVSFEGYGVEGRSMEYDSCSYPEFVEIRAAVAQQAESIAVSYYNLVDLTYGSQQNLERVWTQYVSGWMFRSFGLRPALGRLLTDEDDGAPGAHPVAVLSYDYWTRRFARDPGVLGRTFQLGDGLYQIVGVLREGFTGTETGTAIDIFLPMAMKDPVTLASPNNFWLRTLVHLKPGVSDEPVRQRLLAVYRSIQAQRAKGFLNQSKAALDRFRKERLLLEPAAAGRSNLQRDYGRPLLVLGVLAALVLLIACANVANLMTARAAARAREMALRVSIGAGRRRLVQLVLVEGAWLAFLAAALGAALTWPAAPLLAGMINQPGDPVRLALPADWRVLGFGLALACAATFLFGIAPALRASAIQPALALRGANQPGSRGRAMRVLVAAQVAFCFVILLMAGLFAASFERLANRPTGYSAARILNLETVTRRPQSPVYWDQVADRLRAVPGVEGVALTTWPLMSGESAVTSIWIDGVLSEQLSDVLRISPGWFDLMRIPLLSGRDFRPSDTGPQVAIVNMAFAKQYFNGANPVGKTFETAPPKGPHVRWAIVGLTQDARSRDNLRIPIRPILFAPSHNLDARGALALSGRGTFVVRTAAANPMAMASMLRLEVPKARPEFRVANIRTQEEIVRARTLRERMLTLLSLFFAAAALLLSGVGLYGVLDYSVVQRRREIGIRLAIGAQAGDIARRVSADVLVMVGAGAAAGLLLGMAAIRYIESLLYQARGADPGVLALPPLAILAAALIAALPAVLRAVRIDPAASLRAD